MLLAHDSGLARLTLTTSLVRGAKKWREQNSEPRFTNTRNAELFFSSLVLSLLTAHFIPKLFDKDDDVVGIPRPNPYESSQANVERPASVWLCNWNKVILVLFFFCVRHFYTL